MPTFTYPTNAELRQIAQVKIPLLTENDLIFQFFPMRDVDAPTIMWEQMDNYIGLQQLRGLNGDPQRVKPVGGKRYVMEPGVFGEFTRIDEVELTMRRPYGEFNGSVSIDDLVTMRQDQQLGRELDRIRYILWTLAVSGTFAVSLPTGGVGFTDAYNTQTYAGSAWGTPATGTPLADLRGVQLLGRGSSSTFDQGAVAVMNRVTANKLLANTNQADLGGKRTAGLSNLLSLSDINGLATGEGLPTIVVYDEGYLSEPNGAFVPFIPDNKVVVFGRRPGGAGIGSYVKTRNANNPGMAPGSYSKVVDNGEMTVPRAIDVHSGHNGGPTLEFPGAIVVITTT